MEGFLVEAFVNLENRKSENLLCLAFGGAAHHSGYSAARNQYWVPMFSARYPLVSMFAPNGLQSHISVSKQLLGSTKTPTCHAERRESLAIDMTLTTMPLLYWGAMTRT